MQAICKKFIYAFYIIKLVIAMRKIRNIIKEKAGVSPIIAIILMVAITVVLAATIYVWVSGLGKGGTAKTFPSLDVKDASGSPSASGDALFYIEHRGGEALDFSKYNVYYMDSNDTSWSLVTINGILDVGERCYFYYSTTGTAGKINVAINPNPLTGTYKIRMVDKDTNSIVFEGVVTVA